MKKSYLRVLSVFLTLSLLVGMVGFMSIDTSYAASKKSSKRPDYCANLFDYETRANCYVVYIKNFGNKTLTITAGDKVTNIDYKVYDRKIRLKKKVVIKPGKEKKVKFYVKGRTTWIDEQDFKLYFYFKYDGKKYKGKASYIEGDLCSKYKKGSKWKVSFISYDKCEAWLDEEFSESL